MSEFEIGKVYQPRYGTSEDRFTVIGKDDRYIYYTKESVQNMTFRERYIRHPSSETVLTNVWTSSSDAVGQV